MRPKRVHYVGQVPASWEGPILGQLAGVLEEGECVTVSTRHSTASLSYLVAEVSAPRRDWLQAYIRGLVDGWALGCVHGAGGKGGAT